MLYLKPSPLVKAILQLREMFPDVDPAELDRHIVTARGDVGVTRDFWPRVLSLVEL